MSGSFRYGDKQEISYEQFVQKMKNVQSSTNAELWKLFGIFDKDNNGRIEKENVNGAQEAKSLFEFFKNYAGNDNILQDSEIEKMLKDPQIVSRLDNKDGFIASLKEFFNNLNNNSIEIQRGNETITVSKLESDGTFLAENFIKKTYKNDNGEEVCIVKDKNGRITETVTKNENESVTTIYNTSSIYVYENFKQEPLIQAAQVMIKNGEEFFVMGNLYYNQRYSVKGDSGNERVKFDENVSGLEIVFKRTLSKDELAKARLSKDCDRLGLSNDDVHKIAGILSESMSNEQLMDAITGLQ